MTPEEKIAIITETLEMENAHITPDTELLSLDEWDSMGVISIIAMLDRKFNKVLNAEEISSMKLLRDIIDLMN